jgi:2,4-dichlorophenol 6-monooxygenase
MSTNSVFDCDVVVVGTGPTGGTAALALATYGVRVHVVSKWNWLANTPRAHIANQRAMEVLRDLGVEEEAKQYSIPWELIGDTTFATSFGGPEIARLETWGTGIKRHGDYVQGSPCGLIDLIQPLSERVLMTNAAQRGAQFSFNTEYLGHEQDDNGVTVRLRNRITGEGYTRRARYLVGADGARSQIADEIGLEIVGHLARAGQVYALFNADLSSYVAHRPSVLNYIMQPDAGFGEIGMGVLRAVRAWDQWMAGWGFDMSQGEPDLDPGRALERIRALVGDPNLQAEVEWVLPWYVNQAYATTYSKGRVFCGGDAVHRHPPSSGLGSNTCIQDAFNLAWKLAYVIKGYAGEDLLESYSAERAPVGEQIVARANQSRLEYAPMREAFAAGESDDPIAAGLAKIRARTPEGAATRAALLKAVKLKSDEFNAQGIELNQRYNSTAVIPDPAAGEERWARDPKQHLQATTRPGAKIPHAWLVDEQGRRTSTLDVTGRGMFSLVTGLSGEAWAAAARELDLPYLRTVVVGDSGYEDLYGYWADVCEVEEAGAVLVRPDGYVAWRVTEAVYDAETATSRLRDALDAVLGTLVATPAVPQGQAVQHVALQP